jgi:hypothetical protein
VLVRLLLLIALAVTMVAGGAATNGVALEAEVQLVELEAEDDVVAELPVVDANVASPAPRLVRGTEADHGSPELGRVFRPPRVAIVRVA